jgi:antitoxin MazE
MNTIRTRIVKIGNSRGIRIPKVLIDQLGLEGEVEISVQRNHLIVQSASSPRDNWEEQFRAMAERGDDRLLDTPTPTEWDRDEWQW